MKSIKHLLAAILISPISVVGRTSPGRGYGALLVVLAIPLVTWFVQGTYVAISSPSTGNYFVGVSVLAILWVAAAFSNWRAYRIRSSDSEVGTTWHYVVLTCISLVILAFSVVSIVFAPLAHERNVGDKSKVSANVGNWKVMPRVAGNLILRGRVTTTSKTQGTKQVELLFSQNWTSGAILLNNDGTFEYKVPEGTWQFRAARVSAVPMENVVVQFDPPLSNPAMEFTSKSGETPAVQSLNIVVRE